MAALSYYTNWGTFQPELNSETSHVLAQPETHDLLPEFFNGNLDTFHHASCNNFNHVFDPNDYFCSENCNFLLPDYNLDGFLVELETSHSMKRQKVHDYEQVYNYSELNPSLANYIPPEFVMPEFVAAAPVYSAGGCETKPLSNGRTLSSQSIAARQRRRKITEKTQELGKLIPGGQRMNTAEMLQSAYKYIKFLQSQVGILEFMGKCHQENGESELHELLESPLIQEKLYSSEKCLVPDKFVQGLATDRLVFESKPQLLKEVEEMIRQTKKREIY